MGRHTTEGDTPMTILDTNFDRSIAPVRFRPVMLDLYKGIHKGIRSELFALVGEAGRLDPEDECGIVALASQVRSVVNLLEVHAGHEDRAVEPVLAEVAPYLAERIDTDHRSFEIRLAGLTSLVDDIRTADSHRDAIHEVYIELASFTGTYLLHQDVEEREVNPTLEDAIGIDGMLAIHREIVGKMDPRELIAGLSAMLPAMNVDDRTEMLGGIRSSAPAEAFAAVWSLAGSVLAPAEFAAVAKRLGEG